MKLDHPSNSFRKHLYEASDIVVEAFEDLEERKVFHGSSPGEVAAVLQESLPAGSQEMEALMQEVRQKVMPYATYNSGPYCNSYVLSCGNQAGTIAGLITAFLNQNCGKWHLSSVGTEMEKLVIQWISDFLKLQSLRSGLLVSGGSMANLICLAVARDTKLRSTNEDGLFGQTPQITYVSEEVHHCVIKALQFLGFGAKQVRTIPVRSDLSMDLTALEREIRKDRELGLQPFCVVASAGTVNTGIVDPLRSIGEICRQNDMWYHIDGAYGATAAAIPAGAELLDGMDMADSLAMDPHKWLYVPIEAGCCLFKNMSDLRSAFSHIPDYLAADRMDERMDFMEHGMQLSRGFKALKIWMTFKAYGSEKLRAAIEHDIEKTQYLASVVENADDFEVVAQGPLSILCFRYSPKGMNLTSEELEDLNLQLLAAIENDGRVFVTGTKVYDKTVLRICFVNHRARLRHVDRIFSVVKELAGVLKERIEDPQNQTLK